MQSQKAAKWFDFGAGVDLSLRQSGGRYIVRLEMMNKPNPVAMGKAYDAGWAITRSPNDGGPIVFEHASDVRGLSDVVERLESFFDKARILESIRVTDRLPTEIAPTQRTAPEVAFEVLSVFSKEAPEQLLKHITSSISNAYAVAGARAATAKQLPFEGDGFGVYERLLLRVDPMRAAEAWGSALAAASLRLDGWEATMERLLDADAANIVPEIETIPMVRDFLGSAIAEINAINATGLTQVDVATGLRAKLVEAAGQNIGYRAYDGAQFKPAGAPDLAGNTFSTQPGVSVDLGTDAKARLTLALSASARAFGLSRDRLFGEGGVKFFFAPDMGRSGGSDTRGSASGYTANDIKLFAIHIVPTRPGALIHEIGHQVHNSGDTAEILRAVKHHEFARSTRRLVSELESKGFVTPKFAEYLVSPAEIFARAFDVHVAMNQTPGQFGGSLSSLAGSSLTPTGAELSAFMSDMRTIVLENRETASETIDQNIENGRPRSSQPAMGI